jgi:hypothetical protein
VFQRGDFAGFYLVCLRHARRLVTVRSKKQTAATAAALVVGLVATMGRETVSRDELVDAGMTPAAIARAVDDGWMRSGMTGYWLRRAPDAGAMAVMRGAMSETNYETD